MKINTHLAVLQQRLGEAFVFTTPELCWPYGTDNTGRFVMPEAVVFPSTHDDVVFITEFCNQHQIPLVPRGLGSGAVGGAVPLHQGIVMSMVRMNRILNIDAKNRVMTAEVGVTNFAIQEAARAHQLFWAPDPGSREFCSLGGNLSHNSSGPRAIKYGTTRDNTLGLTAVTGEGKTIHTGAYTLKSVVGYDLTRLLIGSEGTLATITQAHLKLLPLPTEQITLRAVYRSIEGAVDAIIHIMSQTELPAALEFMDNTTVDLVRRYAGIDIPSDTKALLLIGLDGNPHSIEDILNLTKKSAAHPDLIEINIAKTQEESHALWQARRHLSPSLKHVAPKKINEDIVVPVATLPFFIQSIEKLSNQYGITIVSFGHAGSGNIHVNLMYDPNNPAEASIIDEALQAVFDLVLSLKGSLSGEHGIGLNKQPFINQEIDPQSLQLMQGIKALFDPNGILNPGKIWP